MDPPKHLYVANAYSYSNNAYLKKHNGLQYKSTPNSYENYCKNKKTNEISIKLYLSVTENSFDLFDKQLLPLFKSCIFQKMDNIYLDSFK